MTRKFRFLEDYGHWHVGDVAEGKDHASHPETYVSLWCDVSKMYLGVNWYRVEEITEKKRRNQWKTLPRLS